LGSACFHCLCARWPQEPCAGQDSSARGYGFFYDRFGLGNLLDIARYSGGAGSQTQNTITNPTCFDPNSLSAILNNPAMCGTANANAKTIIQVTPKYHSPYNEQFSTSLERQVSKTTSLSVTYLRTFGVHQMITRNSNAYLPVPFFMVIPP